MYSSKILDNVSGHLCMIAQILPRRGRAIANQHALQLFLFLKRVCFEYYNQKLAIEWFYNAHNPKNITIFVLLQYNSKGKKTSFEAKPHGNSKNKSASFLPTNKSTRDEIKVAKQMKPKKSCSRPQQKTGSLKGTKSCFCTCARVWFLNRRLRIQRCGNWHRAFTNPFASSSNNFGFALKLLRIKDQWYTVFVKCQFVCNRDLSVLTSMPFDGTSSGGKCYGAVQRRLSFGSFQKGLENWERNEK